MIWLGDVQFQIAEKICGLRLNNSAHSHIQAFGVWDGERSKHNALSHGRGWSWTRYSLAS